MRVRARLVTKGSNDDSIIEALKLREAICLVDDSANTNAVDLLERRAVRQKRVYSGRAVLKNDKVRHRHRETPPCGRRSSRDRDGVALPIRTHVSIRVPSDVGDEFGTSQLEGVRRDGPSRTLERRKGQKHARNPQN